MMIRAEKNEQQDDDFSVEVEVSKEAINLTRSMYDNESMGEIELVDTILSILTEIYNIDYKGIIPLKHTETFQLSASDDYTFEIVVSLIKDSFKGEVTVKK